MPVQHSPPARQTRSQARAQAVLSPTPNVPLDRTPAISQLRAQLDRGPCLTFKDHFQSPGEDGEEEEEISVEEDSDDTEGVPAPV
ncbi:hypothetical protein O181_015243 [Austropuccinia psidii MF-1]|uniref:Uncharacterized protein n=1 Tax=Austropuccinia psidii MF-1 TaxID=1389203 RepID=A0A9Q3C2T8_9BASI|nr:hypothetical protein [Austropuccinia psidii MF-1]